MTSNRTRNRPYQICTRCIMDTTDPDIVFDCDGVCNHCTTYFERVQNEVFSTTTSKAELTRLVATIKEHGKAKEYDCIIGVSGGVDSTYVAYSVKRLGLRPLAVHFDNGWNSELAVDNIKKTLEALDIDLYTYVVDWDEFRDLQLAFLRSGVENCEIPTDHAILALLFRSALKHRIKYIVSGSNVRTEGIHPIAWSYYSHDLRLLRSIQRRFGTMRLRSTPQLGIAGYLGAVLARGVRIVNLLNYVDYSQFAAIELLENELGWRRYSCKHFESVYTRFFQGYILPTKFGFDKRRAHLSALICAGEKTRELALAEIATSPYLNCNLKQDRDFVLKKLGLSSKEFDEIMTAPVKTIRDYPSNAIAFQRLSYFRRKFQQLAKSA